MKKQFYIMPNGSSFERDDNRFETEAQARGYVLQLLQTCIQQIMQDALECEDEYDDATILQMAKDEMESDTDICLDQYMIGHEFIITEPNEQECHKCGWIFVPVDDSYRQEDYFTGRPYALCERCVEKKRRQERIAQLQEEEEERYIQGSGTESFVGYGSKPEDDDEDVDNDDDDEKF